MKLIFKNILLLTLLFSINNSFSQEYMAKRLKPIRENFKRINAIKIWSNIKTLELNDSTEGGEVIYFFNNDKIEKIIVRLFGETGKVISEFYLTNNQLSFVFEKNVKYNGHIMEEGFDTKNSEIMEDRSYFENGKLIRQINTQDCGSPFAEDYLKEENIRLNKEYKEVLKKLN